MTTTRTAPPETTSPAERARARLAEFFATIPAPSKGAEERPVGEEGGLRRPSCRQEA